MSTLQTKTHENGNLIRLSTAKATTDLMNSVKKLPSDLKQDSELSSVPSSY